MTPSYTAKQHQAALASIAMTTLALNRLLMLTQEAEGEEQAWMLDAAQHLAKHIGGMADNATGGHALGMAEVWNHDPNFLVTQPTTEPAKCSGCPARWTDIAPVDYFDNLQEQGRVAIRSACSLTSKPCMNGYGPQ